MILKMNHNKNNYGKYFLATEAPDDEDVEVTEEQPKPRRNVKVISVKPSNRRKDFTQVGNDPITPDTTEVDDSIDLDDTDYNQEQINDIPQQDEVVNTEENETTVDTTEPQVETDNEENNTEVTEDDAPDTGADDNTDFTDTGETPPETADTGEDAPDIDGDEDFTDTGDEDTTTDTSMDSDSTQNSEDKLAPAGVDFDSTRKYNLYKEYMSLYNACDNYISKLENILRNDYEENQIIRISVNNLREIKDILLDYMTIRFQLNTYVQSLLFYQKMIVSVQLVFKLLKSIKPVKKK